MSVRIGGTDQSYVNPDDPTHLEYDYIQRLADVIDAHGTPGERLRVIHLGGAGLTLARYVAHTRPSSAQIVCEPDEELTTLVRQELPLPRNSGIKVRPQPGREGLAAMRDDFADVIVVDAFSGAQVPAEFSTIEFIAELERVLVPGGVGLMNLTDRAPFGYAKGLVAGFTKVFSHCLVGAEPSTLKGRRFGNLVIAGSTHPIAVDALARKAAGSVFPYRLMHGPSLASWQGGALSFDDSAPQPSPPPPAGKTVFS